MRHHPLGGSRETVHLISRRLAIAEFLAVPFAVAKPWDNPTFPNWSADFVDRVLTDSPWAKSSTVSFELSDDRRFTPASFHQIGFPGGGIGLPGAGVPGIGWPTGGSRTLATPRSGPAGRPSSVRTEIYITTRWASALPVRQAMALHQFGAAGLDSERALELLNRDDSDYIIDVAGFPTTLIRQGAARFEQELMKTVRLEMEGHRAVRATSVTVPEHGMYLIATLRFPRYSELSSKNAWIEVNAESGPLKVRERFKLKDMMYAGRLEL